MIIISNSSKSVHFIRPFFGLTIVILNEIIGVNLFEGVEKNKSITVE